jgi:phosphoribosylformylglycinamidine (FGAM) synthase-like amidotransferase family enzyme
MVVLCLPHAGVLWDVDLPGSNGDREMVAALYMAGFEVWDITMSDLCEGRIALDGFRGLVFVGGFSYADVCGSAKVSGRRPVARTPHPLPQWHTNLGQTGV